MRGQRQERVGELLREDISQIIQRELTDPRLARLISVTEVSVSPDLRQARVYVSVYGSAEEQQQAMAALEYAARRIRGHLSRTVRLRHIPELEFELDTSLERADRIMRLLDEIKAQGSGEKQTGDDGEDRGADSQQR
jgi:ribosome-binding factor A